MQRREVILDSFEMTTYGATAKARLRFKNKNGVVVNGGLMLQAEISDELREHIKFQIESELAKAVGTDVETFSDGTVPKEEFEEVY